MNVLVVDYTGDSASWLATHCKKDLNVLHTIKPKEQRWSKYLESREYDAIFIFESNKREFFSGMAEFFNIPDERIIYALDMASWLAHKWAAYAFLNEDSLPFRFTDYLTEKSRRKYSVCTVEDISYVGYAGDTTIMLDMYQSGTNWSKADLVIFHNLANSFYNLSGRKYFLDLGANIGTTSIYFQKKLDAEVKVLAFEPDPETYRLLRANFILNGMPEDSILENYGLADKETDMVLHRSDVNPGANSLILDHNNGDVSVHVVTLDDYLERNNISMDEIKYIWIDTEGFEAQLFMGMKKLIATQSVPIFLEWSSPFYVHNGIFDDFVNLITDNFKCYIDLSEIKSGNKTVHNTTDLWNYKNRMDQTDIFLIK